MWTGGSRRRCAEEVVVVAVQYLNTNMAPSLCYIFAESGEAFVLYVHWS